MTSETNIESQYAEAYQNEFDEILTIKERLLVLVLICFGFALMAWGLYEYISNYQEIVAQPKISKEQVLRKHI